MLELGQERVQPHVEGRIRGSKTFKRRITEAAMRYTVAQESVNEPYNDNEKTMRRCMLYLRNKSKKCNKFVTLCNTARI